jgi:hypothetical protein
MAPDRPLETASECPWGSEELQPGTDILLPPQHPKAPRPGELHSSRVHCCAPPFYDFEAEVLIGIRAAHDDSSQL